MYAHTRRVLIGLGVGLALLALVVPTTARADLVGEVHQGQHLANSAGSGQSKCSDLSAEDFELIGEYAMNIHLPTIAAHESMNQHMTAMMGSAGERRMHIILGRRYLGCASGSGSGWLAPMLGVMSHYGGQVRPGMDPGMMSGRGYGPSRPDNGDDIGIGGIAAIAFGAALLAGLLVALGFWLRHRSA